MMNRIVLQGLLTFAVVTSALTPSVIATQRTPNTIQLPNTIEQPNIIEPMCKKGKISVLQKSTQTLRSYNGELCKIVPIAHWVMNNCKDNDEFFSSSDCKLNAKYALKNINSKQNEFLSTSHNLRIEDPQDVSDLMEIYKDYAGKKAISPNELNVWQKYKLFFPKPSPKPFLHFKQ